MQRAKWLGKAASTGASAATHTSEAAARRVDVELEHPLRQITRRRGRGRTRDREC